MEKGHGAFTSSGTQTLLQAAPGTSALEGTASSLDCARSGLRQETPEAGCRYGAVGARGGRRGSPPVTPEHRIRLCLRFPLARPRVCRMKGSHLGSFSTGTPKCVLPFLFPCEAGALHPPREAAASPRFPGSLRQGSALSTVARRQPFPGLHWLCPLLMFGSAGSTR